MSAQLAPPPPVRVAPPLLAAENFAANCQALRQRQSALLGALPGLPAGLKWVLGRDGSLTALDLAGADLASPPTERNAAINASTLEEPGCSQPGTGTGAARLSPESRQPFDGQPAAGPGPHAGAWWAGCSLPWRAARGMFKTLDLQSPMGCFLAPGWAAQARVCLDLIEPRQGIIAVIPALADLVVMLHCERFSADISAGRLWLVAGEDWPRQIETLLDAEPGVVVPTQFVRAMNQRIELIDAMIPPAQKAFAQVNARRQSALAQSHAQHAPTGRVCVVCPSQFALWQEAGAALAEAMAQSAAGPDAERPGTAGPLTSGPLTSGLGAEQITWLDPDSPISASTLALAKATENCDRLLIPDAGRGDLPGTVADGVAWITWVTRGQIPPAGSAGPRDRLLLADPAWQRAALDAGWPAQRIAIAQWPAAPALPPLPPAPALGPDSSLGRLSATGRAHAPDACLRGAGRAQVCEAPVSGVPATVSAQPPASPRPSGMPQAPGGSPHLALIADTLPAVAPKVVSDFSSQEILWDHIRGELLSDPFAVGDDAELFLKRLLRALEIPDSPGLDRRIFLAELILPAYQHGVALTLIRAGVPVKIFGKGWDAVSAKPDCAALQSAWAGPLNSIAELRSAITGATAMVHAWPSRSAHPIYRYGRPLLGPALSPSALLREATRLIRGGAAATMPNASPITLARVLGC